jgi:hypothetical protein
MRKISDKINLFRSIFNGRQDIIPRYWISKDGQRAGYTPLCKNEWEKDICQKPCRTCPNADYIPLSGSLILDHFKGKYILGVYPLLKDNTCHFIAADFDNHQGDRDPLADVKEFYEVCQIQGIPCYVLRSKSGKGYHAFIFFSSPVPAWKARIVAFALLQEAQVIGDDAELSSFDRLFPNQGRLSGKGFGNLIALPFQGIAAKKGHTLLLDPQTGFIEPYKAQWDVLDNVERIPELKLDELIREWNLKREGYQAPNDSGYVLNSTSEVIKRLMKCEFFKWCKNEPANVPEPLWFALISNLVCVRPGGYSLCHELSKGYPEYSQSETDAKIHHALDGPGPHTCEYIRRNGFDCEQDCGVKAPAGLINLGQYKQNGDPENVKRIKVSHQ